MSVQPNKSKLPSGELDHNSLVESLSKMISDISKTYSPLVDAMSVWSKEFQKTQIAISKSLRKIDFSGIAEFSELFARSLEGHFPDNWPEGKLSEGAALCINGVPIIFVPRKEIVYKLIQASDVTSIKKIMVANDTKIISDCEKAFAESTWLPKDMNDHISDALKSYKMGMYRASQSTSAIAFDSLLNEVINMRKLRKDHRTPRKLSHSVVNVLTNQQRFKGDLMQIPLGREPFYTLLMFPVIGGMLAPFVIGDKTTYTKELNRHESVHTVSRRQYKRSNALWSIMVIASICKITQLRKKNWMQVAAKAYGVTLS